MDQLIDMAQNLGKAISQDQRTVQLKAAQEAVDADAQAGELVTAYEQQMNKMNGLAQKNQPIEVADKTRLKELEDQLAAHPLLSELMRRQVDFVDLMRKVKQAIDQQLHVQV